MEAQDRFQISASDHAIRLSLTIKMQSLRDAEEYFENISNSTSKKVAFLPLLNSYVQKRATEKAEALMLKMNDLGLIVSPHPYNSMMKLYYSTSQFEKVLSVIQLMGENRIPKNILSYNIWMIACNEVSGPASAEVVYKEMVTDNQVLVGWSSLSTLADIYIKARLVMKATSTLRYAEKKLSTSSHNGYFFLITLYTSLRDKDSVLRVWEACKKVKGKITCTNYMCVLLSLVKLGEIQEAENIFREWESNCRKYDIRVSNVLLGAYKRKGLMEKAELLHLHTLQKGGCPNYKTWEILMEGWVEERNMDKAIAAMENGIAMLEHCEWRPSSSIVLAIAMYYENNAKFEEAKQYLTAIRRFHLASLPVYKSLLRMHVSNQSPANDILEMMQKDKIDMDDEIFKLVQVLPAISLGIEVK